MQSQQEKNIFDCLGEEELLCQLAEEAGELTQAALKYRRTITKKILPLKQVQKHLIIY